MNGVDPLAELRPIRLPPEIGWWPPAFGWWIVTALLLLALALVCLWTLRHWRSNRYRREALREFDALLDGLDAQVDQTIFAAASNALLRRTALCRYPASAVASLTGNAWLAFLDRSGRTTAFSHGAGRALAAAPYDPAAGYDTPALHRACRDWLRRHR